MSLREIKGALACHRRFKNRCYVCRKPFGKGFAFHHIWYIINDVKYSDYKDSLKYHIQLEELILQNPKRFLLLCRVHHHFVEWGNKLNEPAFKRFVKAVGMTRKARRWEAKIESYRTSALLAAMKVRRVHRARVAVVFVSVMARGLRLRDEFSRQEIQDNLCWSSLGI